MSKQPDVDARGPWAMAVLLNLAAVLQRGGDHAAAQARLLKVGRCRLTLSNPR